MKMFNPGYGIVVVVVVIKEDEQPLVPIVS